MFRKKSGIAALVVIDVTLFMLSGIPRLRDATEGADLVLGQIVWIGFLLGLLALIVLGVLAVARELTHKEKTS